MGLLELLSQPEVLVSLLTLTAMEIVLGIDNIVFISILCGRLPKEQEPMARRIGIGVALVSRLLLLFAINWVMKLQSTLFTVPVIAHGVSGKDLILLFGGIFLVGKASHEIYENVEEPTSDHIHSEGEKVVEGGEPSDEELARAYSSIMFQVLLLDFVFSIDSVITAVGMTEHITVMVIAMIIAVTVMLIFAGPIGNFIQRTPSVRILALAFLILIGVMLIMDGTGQHVSKGYIYSAMGFALFVEVVNLRRRRNAEQRGEPEEVS